MRIYFSSYHKYPGSRYGVAAHAVHDYLVKGLSELGHQVFYHLKEAPFPDILPHVTFVNRRITNADIFHINSGPLDECLDDLAPWVKITHSDIRIQGLELSLARPNWIYVSRSLAKVYNSDRYVYNGIDPGDFNFNAKKKDYLFFIVGGLNRAKMKGIETALEIAQISRQKLIVAGNHADPAVVKKFDNYCRENGAEFIGPVYGAKKATLFSEAKGILFPSLFNEACPLVVAEALLSGTPVITSSNGALPELVPASVGFVCDHLDDYLDAVDQIGKIDPVDCREYAINKFHYRVMAENYIREYRNEINHVNVKAKLEL